MMLTEQHDIPITAGQLGTRRLHHYRRLAR